MARPWDDILSEQDKAVIIAAGYDTRGASAFDSRSMGAKPALLVIDMQQLIVGDDVPILQAVQGHPIAIGEAAHRAVERIAPFMERCRGIGLPVIYTRIMLKEFDPHLQIVEALRPHADDLVIDKHHPSAFFGTPLLNHLRGLGIDTVIVTGNSTSGCVRASVVDARQHGFHVIVPQELVFDRLEASHKVGLLDMWMKYASVLSSEEMQAYLEPLGAQSAYS